MKLFIQTQHKHNINLKNNYLYPKPPLYIFEYVFIRTIQGREQMIREEESDVSIL